jgi:hypothetical protein
VKAQEEHTREALSRTQRRSLVTTILRDTSGFASLQAEWDDLYESCPSATPFQSWAWLYSWWELYGEGNYGLRLITVRERSGLLVGLLPLMVRHGPSFGRLLLVGGDKLTLYSDVMTPYKDVLVREGFEEPVARAGARAVMGMDGWRVADLQELMPEAAAWDLFRRWEGLKTSVPIADYVLMHAVSWEDLLASLSKKLRKTARRTLRHAEEDGLRCKPASSEDIGQAARRLVGLHRELWKGRRIAPEHLTPRYEALVETAARRMIARGNGRISEFWRDGVVHFSQFVLFDKDFAGVYLIGASEDASRRYQYETLMYWDAMNVARGTGSAYVSFMDGTSRDKLRWASEVVSSHRAILGRRRTFWVPYAGYHVLRARYYSLRSAAQSYIYSENAPRWVKDATQRYYALLSYIYSESAPKWVKNATQIYWDLRQDYGSGMLRYKYESARARRGMERGNHLTQTLSKRGRG